MPSPNDEGEGIDDDPVLVDVNDGVLYITLNRPRVLNAQNQPMREALVEALDRLDEDGEIRVGVLTGVGGRAFSSGADLKELTGDPASSRVPVPVAQRPNFIHFRRLERVRKPMIAAIDGYAVGGGLELSLLCDLRVATEQSTFAMPEPRTTGRTGEVAVHRLSRMIPLGEAMRLHLTASPINAERAYSIGLVQYLAANRDAMFETVRTIVTQIKQCDPVALELSKIVAKRSHTLSISESESFLLALQHDAFKDAR